MHIYHVTPDPQRRICFVAAVLGILSAWALGKVLAFVLMPLWWLDAPAAFGFYNIWLWLGDNVLWKWRFLCRFFCVPNVSGSYVGVLRSSYDNFQTAFDVKVRVLQSCRQIRVLLETEQSRSESSFAIMDLQSDGSGQLTYLYLNRPFSDAPETMGIHYGVCSLEFEHASPDKLNGDYYSGRERKTHGTIELHRVHT